MIDFLIKSTVSLAILLLVYRLLLEREKMHRFNRFYLLFSLVFSLIVPFITLPAYSSAITGSLPVMELSTLTINNDTGSTKDYLPALLWSIYSIITLILATRFALHIYNFIKQVSNNETVQYKQATIVLLNKKLLPHTFLHYIFLNKEDYKNRTIEAELYTHELTHVKQRHTLDILFIELLKTILWFNPLLYFYKKAIQLNHEFLADESVIKKAEDTKLYQNLLLTKATGYITVQLASNLNFSITKKRLIMMTKTTNRLLATVKQLAIVPVLAGLLLISCADDTAKQDEIAAPVPVLPESTSAGNDKIYNPSDVTTPAEFPGGMKAFYENVNRDFIIPEINEDLTAKIYVSFVIEKDGSMTGIKALRDPGHGLGEEAERVLKAITEKWTPAMQDGEPVRISYNLPITIDIKS